jgi:glutathione S-transferase
MSDYRLHCFAQSGNAYKAALTLALCGADWTPVFVDFFNGGARTPEYLALNEMGEVPVLETPDGTVIQSALMLETLALRFGRFGWEGEAERREIWRWLLWDNHKLTANIATWRFMTNFLPPEKRSAEVIGFVSGRARTAMGVLERRLAGRHWIVGDRPTIADLSCCGYLFFMDEIGQTAQDWPSIAAWTGRIAALPGWRHPYDLMPGHPLPARAG